MRFPSSSSRALSPCLAVPGSASPARPPSSPAAGAPGSTVVVHGTGFPGSKRVTVKLAGRSAVRVKASSGGSFTARVRAPKGRRGWISVSSRSGSRKVVNRFYATRGGVGQVVEVASTSGRRLRITPASITAGQTMRIDGAGFKKGRTVRLSGFGLSRSYKASRSGKFTALVSLPDSLKGGSYRATLRAAGVRLIVGVRVKAATIQSMPTSPRSFSRPPWHLLRPPPPRAARPRRAGQEAADQHGRAQPHVHDRPGRQGPRRRCPDGDRGHLVERTEDLRLPVAALHRHERLQADRRRDPHEVHGHHRGRGLR